MSGTTEWAAAWLKASVWGTAVDTNAAGTRVWLESESMPLMMPEMIEDSKLGDSLAGQMVQGNISGEGTVVMSARYEGIENWLALFMGADSVAAGGTDIGETAGTARQHVMAFKDSNTGKFGTLFIHKGGTRYWEYRTAKISQVELNHNNGKLQMTPTLIPDFCTRVADDMGTVDESLALSTAPGVSDMALFNQLTVRIVETTDGGSEDNLGSSEDLCVTNAQLTVNRNLEGIPDSCGNGTVGEPETSGLPEATLTLSVADYDAGVDAFIQAAQIVNADRKPKTYKAQLLWRGQDIAGSDSATGPGTGGKNTYAIEVDLPALQFEDGPPNGSGPGARVSVDLAFKVVTPQWVPDGTDWAWVTVDADPFRIRVVNENQTSMA